MFVRGVVKILTAKDKSDFILLIQCLLFSEIVTNVLTFLQSNQERYPNYYKIPNFKLKFQVGTSPLH